MPPRRIEVSPSFLHIRSTTNYHIYRSTNSKTGEEVEVYIPKMDFRGCCEAPKEVEMYMNHKPHSCSNPCCRFKQPA